MLPHIAIGAQWGCPLSGAPGEIMGNTDTHFESLLDQVEQLHQAISTGDSSMGTLAEILRDRLSRIESAAAWLDLVEPLRWWKTAVQTPPIDLDVLVSWGDGRGIFMAAWMGEGEGWMGVDSVPLESSPVYWAALPRGPIDRMPHS